MPNESDDPRDDRELPTQAQVAVIALRAGGPGPEALHRLRVGLGIVEPSGSSGEPPNQPGQPPAPSSAEPGTSVASATGVKTLVVTALVVGLGGLWWAGTSSKGPVLASSSMTVASVAMAPAESISSAPQAVDAGAVAAEVVSAAAQPMSSNPSTAVSGKRESEGMSELQFITRAQQLVRSQPHVALSLCREHARRFPNGMLAQERDVLAVEALQRMGRQAEAHEESRSFLQKNPDTAHRNKVEHLTADAAVAR